MFEESSDRNDDYIVGWNWDPGGDLYPWEWRNFFTFDLSTLTGRAVCARLELYGSSLEGQPVEELGLFDVSTPAERLNANGDQSLAIYDDLGTGVSYGHYEVDTTRDNQWLTFPLNPAAVDDINRTTGFFSIGGRLLSIDRNSGTGGTQVLFGYSPLGAVPGQLVVQTIPQPTCFGVPATIVGDDGDNVLIGTPGDDVIVGLGGNDTIHPQRGDDLVCAGAGDDRISDDPYASPDSVDYEVFEHSGDDAFSGGPGDDALGASQSNGADRLFGNDGNDYLYMGDGPMVGWGGRGADVFANLNAHNGLQMHGGPGSDSWRQPFSSSQGNIGNRFFGGDGDDHVYMESASNVKVYGDRGNDTIELQVRGSDRAWNTVLDGGAGDDHLRGAFGVDSVLRGGPGADELIGGAGFSLHGGSGPDTLRGDNTPGLSDDLSGGPGDDTLSALAGDDHLSGGRGSDLLTGGDGDDRLRGRAGNDTLAGDKGDDVLLGGPGRDTNVGGAGSDLCRSPSERPRALSCER